MPAAVPLHVREAAVAAYLNREGTLAEVARRFGISPMSVARFLRRTRSGEDLQPRKPKRTGPKPLLSEDDLRQLKALLEENPHTPLVELQPVLAERIESNPSVVTLRRCLRKLGIKRVRPTRSTTDRPSSAGKPTRYLEQHRGGGGAYPTSLTDAEWAVVEPLLPSSRRGRPSVHDRRVMLDAIFYVVRSGCAWRLLPSDFPPWQSVYACFRRWSDHGVFEVIHDALRERWREREGRAPEPSATIVDSQSVKTTEKGGPEDTTAARR